MTSDKFKVQVIVKIQNNVLELLRTKILNVVERNKIQLYPLFLISY